MIPAHISRLLTFTQHGMPKAYNGSAMMTQDVEWLLRDYRMQTGNVIELQDKGRYHTQLAACDLFDAVELKNERPAK